MDLYGERRLGDLLRRLCRIDGIEWLRLHYAYPAQFPDDVIGAMRDEPKICKYLDIPFQHISDSQLKSMRRGLDKAETYALVENMRRFAEEDLPVTLSLSLHAPNDEVRRKLMPVARKYSMDAVLSACRNYIEKTGRRVIFEYALVHGVNADPAQAVELAGRLRGMQCHVNLIPLNSVPERGLTGVTEREVDAFKHTLEQKGISVTRRREMGDDIEGACGQLRRRYIQDNNLNTEN